MTEPRLTDDDIKALFIKPRTTRTFTDQPVTDETLRAIYDLTRMGPTAFNSQPLRITWVKSADARERLMPLMTASNREKVANAPMTALLSFDTTWYNRFEEFSPAAASMGEVYGSNPELAAHTGENNAHLQAGYFITAIRALGLDAGPMSGADFAAIEQEFFEGKNRKPFMVVNIGYGEAPAYPRGLRFDFDDATDEL